MAKKQSFGDKTSGANKTHSKNRIKLIRSFISEDTGALRFSDDMLKVSNKSTPENTIKEFLETKK